MIEAGLGSEGEDYLSLRLHGFASGTGSRNARAIWGELNTAPNDNDTRLQNPIYQDLEARGLEVCGLTTFAGRAVGASFVGTVGAALCIAELVRLTMNAHRYSLLELSLRNPQLCGAYRLSPTKRLHSHSVSLSDNHLTLSVTKHVIIQKNSDRRAQAGK